MKDQELLSLMFADAEDFRGQLLRDTLRRVRRRRRARQCTTVLAVVTLVASVVWWTLPRSATINAPAIASSGLQTIHTQPLAAERIVTTRGDSVTIITSDKTSLVMLGDDELLEMIPGETKLLVWHAPHEAELVILGP